MAEEFYATAAGIYGGNWLCSPRSSMLPGVGVFSPCFLDLPNFHWPADSVKSGRIHGYDYSGSNDSGFFATDVENGFSPSALSDLSGTLFDDSKKLMDVNSFESILNELSREDSDLYIGGGMSAGNFNNQNQVATSSEDHSSNLDRLSPPSVPKSRSSAKPSVVNKLQPSNKSSVWDSTVDSSARQSQNRPDCPIIGTKIQRNTGAYNTRDVKSTTKRRTNMVESAGPKRPRIETPSPLPTFKVRKEKLGDRITALQQLVSPFGKTDTASVLHEAIEYIKFLHDHVHALSTPNMKNGGHPVRLRKPELRSRGLCLVPISSTFLVAGETPVDFWTPKLGGTFM